MIETPPELERDTLRLVLVFERAERDISARLSSTSGPYTQQVRNQRRGEIRAVLDALRTLLNPDAGREAGPAWLLVKTAYRTGSDRALESLPGDVDRSFGGPHLEAARLLFENLAAALDDALAYVGRRVDDHFRRAALEELTTSELSGRTRRETSRAIEGNLADRGVRAFRDKAGREWSLARYAEMVARTTSREAHTTATLNRLAENGIDLVRISKHAHDNDVCSKYEDRIYSISGTHPEYPQLVEAPPYHPQCRHSLTGFIERLAA